MKKTIIPIILAALLISSAACSKTIEPQANETTESVLQSETKSEIISAVATGEENESAPDKEETLTASITLQGDSIIVEGSGVSVEGSKAAITTAGSYQISGKLNDGQIRVDTIDEGDVELILDGVDITNSNNAPIYVLSADQLKIKLADGSVNTVADGDTYILTDTKSEEPNAAIFSTSDLTIKGSGTLIVNANANNGITSKDDLKIKNGTITINAVNDGIKGKDSVEVEDAVLTINAGADGIQSTNTNDTEKGYITIDSGTINIIAGLDGIQAETNLTINGGSITLATGGGSANSGKQEGWSNPGGGRGIENTSADTSTLESAKGLKAGTNIHITDGIINIDSSDDALHSNDSLTIDGGEIMIASGDDGVHADAGLVINNGNITISKSYEGIESASIIINDGNINITASDDGINVAGGNDGSAVNGRPGQGNFNTTGDYNLTINGGAIVVDASGDGLDANGSIDMTAGKVIVYGPTNNGNGPLDYLGTFNISGGFIAAVGSSGMAQSASASSTQYSLLYNYTTTQSAGTMLHIETQDGEGILTIMPSKDYQSILFSSADLANGITYDLYTGGSSNGAEADGLYSGGEYTAGNLITSFTISSIVTSEGAAGSRIGGGRGDGKQPPGQQMP